MQGEADEADGSGLIWRIKSDLQLVAHNKELMAVCEFLRRLATQSGLAIVDLENHTLQPRLKNVPCIISSGTQCCLRL